MDALAAHFGVSKGSIVATITATLVMRPLGAFLFGFCADRWGRRIPLLCCVLYFSLITALTPLAPSFSVFLVLRALYGIGMGGYWGVGAALVMESCPVSLRGLFSGILQAGYSLGYLLAALMARTLAPAVGWQWLFWSGLCLAVLIVLLILFSSDTYRQVSTEARPNLLRTIGAHWGNFVLLTVLMTLITCLSHGTQDLYPDFLRVVHGFSLRSAANMAIFYNVGAVLGAVVFGRVSDWLGRRNSIYMALLICLLAVPAWAFGGSVAWLAAGAFMMQFGVQGAFGVIPAHLNELAPEGARGLFPGLVYQFGVLLGAPCVMVEYALRDSLGYARALAVFELITFALLAAALAVRREQRGRELMRADA
ncbi:MFS transporter [Terriglobus albidus]|uniref:MFS transporter n=2 Tax=Terriglobus albidus TaxID=1592106 RepID=A0A5B9EGE4_9BACT|nr:MFS transporter [Terriglobus albidus]